MVTHVEDDLTIRSREGLVFTLDQALITPHLTSPAGRELVRTLRRLLVGRAVDANAACPAFQLNPFRDASGRIPADFEVVNGPIVWKALLYDGLAMIGNSVQLAGNDVCVMNATPPAQLEARARAAGRGVWGGSRAP